MSNRLKGLVIEIGGDTTKLDKSLKDVNSRSSKLSSELSDINRLLKLDPTNTDLLAQKQKVLAGVIESTKEKLKMLQDAEKNVQKQFEKGTATEEQVRALQREIASTASTLEKYEKDAKTTANTVEKLGTALGKAQQHVSDLSDEEQDAKKGSSALGDTLDDKLQGGLKAVAAAAAGSVTAIIAAAEASREYRTAIGKLDTAFQVSGFTAEQANETYREMVGILGETDQAVEASNHLAKLTDNAEDLSKWTDICTGVFATFGDSLPVEGLTEAANETAKVGQVVGPLADALNWAGVSEDNFNVSLAACSDEQERQQLITSTLTGLYSDAADTYRKTNGEVIAANKATDDWNAAMARMGKQVDPVMSSIKEMGVELIDSGQKPIMAVASLITDQLLPAAVKVTKWTSNNLPTIKAIVVGLAGAMAAYKAVTIATTAADEGLAVALLGAEKAQKLLNLAQAATPWGLAAVAVVGVVTAIVAYSATLEKASMDVNVLSDDEKNLVTAANAAGQAFRDQKAASDEAAGQINSQMDYTKSLADQLLALADANGQVKESDQMRAQVILGELNSALGTDYAMTDGLIDKYGELKNGVYDLIDAKRAEALMEAYKDDWVTALKTKQQALDAINATYKDYQTQLDFVEQKEAEYQNAQKMAINADGRYTSAMAVGAQTRSINLGKELDDAKSILAQKKGAYDTSASDYGLAMSQIDSYENARAAIQQGNYTQAVQLLTDEGQAYSNYADTVGTELGRQLQTLEDNAVEAGVKAAEARQNFANGVEGFGYEQVEEAERNYQDAMDAYEGAYGDAYGVGEDIGDGMTNGLENKRTGILSKIKSIVSSIFSTARRESDSHSPSRKMVKVFEDIGEGGIVGLDNETEPLLRTARDQMRSLMRVYGDQDAAAARVTLSTVGRAAVNRQSDAMEAVADRTSGKLDKILAAIEAGQVIMLDKKTMVGATARDYDASQQSIAIRAGRGG